MILQFIKSLFLSFLFHSWTLFFFKPLSEISFTYFGIHFLWIFIPIVVLTALILFFVIRDLEIKNKKRMMNHLVGLLPETNRNQPSSRNIKLEDFSKNISQLAETQSSEIDLLKKQENYRREFLGNVSHELKTPLFSIQGFLLTLIEGGLEDEKIRDRYLNRINKSVERLIYIVKDLDLISELESGNLSLEKKVFNIQSLTQEVFDLLDLKAKNNSINLTFDDDYDEPVKVIGDIEKMEQVLINLLANAINYSTRPTKVIVRFIEESEKIRVEVTDFGIGIKKEYLPRIFERFYRIDRSRSRQMGGSGLGLAIVKHILEAHNERINVESEYGKGTTFYFSLPKA